MKQFLKNAKAITILILMLSLIGCDNDDSNLPEVLAGFTYTLNADTGAVTFINISENSTSYIWDFGNGSTSKEINPKKTYINGTYTITLTASNVAGASDTFESTIIIDIPIPIPVITLNGNATMNVTIGGSFTDPGATATDGFGTDISSDIVVAGDTVDVNTAGTYTITYDVNDAAGNAATQVTRTVIVAADTIAPVITLNGNATVNVTVGGTFTDPGATAMDNLDGDISSSIVVAGDMVDVNTAGTYIITYNVSDAAGNAATQVSRNVIVAASGGGSPSNNLINNGGFESGTAAGWETFQNNGLFEVTDADASCGTFAAHFVADVDAGNGGASFPFIKQQNFGKGTVTPNSQVTISFDLRGTTAGAGGVFIAEFFSEGTVGVSKSEILSGGPLTLNDTWTRYNYTVTTGTDVSNGVTLLLKSECGQITGCAVDAYIDNIFVVLGNTGGGSDCNNGGTGGTGGTGSGSELAVNGDFETGNTSGWATFVDAAGASFMASSTQPSGGGFSGNLVADYSAGSGGAVDAVVKQANLGSGGVVTPNTEYIISFDLRGSASDGGVFFVEFFSELSGGGTSKAEIITGGPHPLSSTWTNYSYTVLTGSDVSGGITLQLKSSCGPVGGCLVDVYFDNVSVKLK